MRSQLDFTGTTAARAPVYTTAVRRLRQLLVPGCAGAYVRPQAKRHDGGLRAAGGRPLVVPPHERLVPVEDDQLAHAIAAAQLPFPHPSIGAGAEPDLVAAVKHAVRERHSLQEFRRVQLALVDDISTSLLEMNRWLTGLAYSKLHAHLVSGANLAFLAAWCDAREWPDTAMVENWVLGYTIVGDIPDSGLFRPQETPPTVPPERPSPRTTIACGRTA